MSGGGIALGGVGTVAVVVISLLMGVNPLEVLQQVDQSPATEQAPNPEQDKQAQFVKVVLADTEDIWNKVLPEQTDKPYVEPKLVLFTGATQSGCGHASSATGPFYCPMDSKVYIDLSFYDDLQNRFQAPGDFAMAYVVAHEVGHHIQHLLGITEQMAKKREELSEVEYNKLSVKLELQADFLAGVWAYHDQKTKNILEAGDIEEALNAANAIGDDRLQKSAGREVMPDAFTHGTSAQRMKWFKKGFETGDISQGNTFADADL
jgi:predicted metalloprotease